ncbi:uncharacterized protein LOC134539198 [Bacillus rossius redtenbacheri]|uniref:uncharacterized protein LOC134539198 n=1 Tax=Bacillus rossius redtenbacheri TaxID=93214 RepID=UPI002FDCD553
MLLSHLIKMFPRLLALFLVLGLFAAALGLTEGESISSPDYAKPSDDLLTPDLSSSDAILRQALKEAIIEEKISIDQILTVAQQDVAKLKSFIDSTAARVSNGVAGVVKGAYSEFNKLAAQHLQHAGAVGSWARRCISGLQSTVNADANSRARGAVQCVVSHVDSAVNDVQTLLGVAQSAERDIGSARAALKACGQIKNALKKAECVTKAAAKVAAEAASLGLKVQGAIADAVKIYNTFPTAVENCERTQLLAAEKDALVLVAKLATC